MLMIDGIVETIIYENAENGYTVCDVASAGQLITMTGYMPNLSEGERIKRLTATGLRIWNMAINSRLNTMNGICPQPKPR